MKSESNINLMFSHLIEYYGNLHVPILVLDRNLQTVYLNESAEDLLGYTSEALERVGFLNIFSSKTQQQVESSVQIVLENPKSAVQALTDVKIRKKSGKTVHVNFSVKCLMTNDYIVVSLHDLTELMLAQREKDTYMRELNHISKLADIGRLTAGVAHELNNPLMIIRGFAENIQLLIDQGGTNKKEILSQVDPIVKASDRMAKIISTMMKFSRDDEVLMVHVDLWEIVEDTLVFMRNRLSESGIQVERDLRSPLCVVKCDPNQIEQIILNILSNAIHALESVPESNRKIRITLDTKEKVVLGIWNNGPEISNEIKDKVMTPFFTTKGVGEGTGLGLSLSYEIMKGHNGELSFSSAKGKGVEFYLTFPISGVLDSFQKISNKRKILVVDDESFIVDLLSHKLARYGYDVLTAKDGEEAKKILYSCPDIDCIFTDIRMPHVDGFQLIKYIKSIRPQTLIYAISGYAGRRSLEMKVKRLGVHGFLSKPIDHFLFSKVVNEIEDHFRGLESKKTDQAS